MKLTRQALKELGAFDYHPPAGVVGAMVPLMPNTIADPERVAAESVRAFEEVLLLSPAGKAFANRLRLAFEENLRPIQRAAASMERSLADLPPGWRQYLADAMHQREIDLDEVLRGLAILQTVVGPRPAGGRQGRNKDLLTDAAIAGARSLMQHQGIKRKRAAAIIEVLISAYPDVPNKTKEVIEQAIRNTES